MRPKPTEYEQLRGVLANADEPLTAREILSLLDQQEAFGRAQRVATILGRCADRGDVEVLEETPYRYRLND